MLVLCERSVQRGGSIWSLLALMVAGGAGQALSQGTLSGLCGLCPDRYMRAFMVGLGASSLVAGSLKILAKAGARDILQVDRIWLGSLFLLYLASLYCYLRRVCVDRLVIAACRDSASDNSGEQTPLLSAPPREP